MKLIGNYLSPYVRRVAVTLNALKIDYTLEPVFVFAAPDAVRPHNPLVRIPTVVLEDGEVLVESYAILDAIDELAGPRALTPARGVQRRQVMRLTAIAVGAMEKVQWVFYEGRFRPPEKVHAPWVEHNEAQVVGGLGYLDARAEAAGAHGWLAGTPGMSQADVSAVVAYTFGCRIRPTLGLERRMPALGRLAARCEALEAFRAAPIPDLP